MRQLPYRTVTWKISMPASVAGRVEQRLSNIEGTGPKYGARSKLIAHLLEEWLNSELDDAAAILEMAKAGNAGQRVIG